MSRVAAPIAPAARARSAGLASRIADSPPWLWVAACALIAALSLLGPHNLTYDAWYWLIWGREILHWDLNTVVGSSWKPGPALVDATYAWTGASVAPVLWLLVARTGSLLALAALVRTGVRLGGLVAGAAALVLFVLVAHPGSEFGVATFISVGWSDLLTVAAAGWALDRHLAGRPQPALWLLAVAALVRPEAWVLLVGYAVWCHRGRRVGLPALLVAVVGVAALWLVPDYLGSGRLLAGSTRAQVAQGGLPAAGSDNSGVGVVSSLRSLLILPTKIALLGSVMVAWRRDRRLWWLLAILVVWVAVVAAMSQLGYPGLERFLATPLALICLLAGVAVAAGIAALGGPRRQAVGLLVAAAVVAVFAPAPLRAIRHHLYRNRAIIRTENQLPAAVAGAERAVSLPRCRLAASGALAVPIVRWYTDRRHVAHSVAGADLVFYQVDRDRAQPRMSATERRRYRVAAHHGQWTVLARCSPAAPPVPRD